MVHLLKVHVPSPSAIPYIRRFAVNSDVVGSFTTLVEKILLVIPTLRGRSFELCWKDTDDDDIVITGDDDLAQAVASSDDGILKLYVRFAEAAAKSQTIASTDIHTGVRCDNCNGKVIGHRYKCLQCEDYDLCIECNGLGKHPFHDMIKLVMPASYNRQWMFRGWKRLFQSMFGRDPSIDLIDRSEWNGCPYRKSSDSSSDTASNEKSGPPPNPIPSVEKCLKNLFGANSDLIGNITQVLADTLAPLGVDVKVDIEHPKAKTPEEKPKEPEEKETVAPEKTVDKETVAPEKTVDKSENTEETKPKTPEEQEKQEPSSSSTQEKNDVPPESQGARPKSGSIPSEKQAPPPSFGGLFGHSGELNGIVDGWTVLSAPPVYQAEKSEPAAPSAPPKHEQEADCPKPYAEIPASEKVYETSAQYPSLVSADFPELADLDPEITKSLLKMMSMGFTNEGGWLLRLLHAKKGNIYAALDSLYPSNRR